MALAAREPKGPAEMVFTRIWNFLPASYASTRVSDSNAALALLIPPPYPVSKRTRLTPNSSWLACVTTFVCMHKTLSCPQARPNAEHRLPTPQEQSASMGTQSTERCVHALEETDSKGGRCDDNLSRRQSSQMHTVGCPKTSLSILCYKRQSPQMAMAIETYQIYALSVYTDSDQ